jgi:hypothetical protein
MNAKIAWSLFVVAAIAAVVADMGWSQSREHLRKLRVNELVPIAALLKENAKLLQSLQSETVGSGILPAYLAKIRADGIAKNAETKQRLDLLAENDAAILVLINLYKSNARTASFNTEAEKFERYAITWRDRWNSVMELFMAGGNYAVVEVPFPTGFPAAVDAEIAAQR